MSFRDDINIPVIVVLGITTGLIVAVAIIGTRAGYNYVTQVQLARNYEDPRPEIQGVLHFGKTLTTAQSAALNEPASYVDKDKTVVRIPVSDAMRIMIDSKGKPPTAK